MLPDSLKEYLKTCKDQQLPFETVSQSLVTSGYSPDVIASAKSWYEGPPSASPSAVSVQPATVAAPSTPPSRRSPLLLISLVFGLLLFLLVGTSVSAYLIATDKIPLKNKILKAQISRVVFSIPFVPKTPKVVFAGVPAAHAKVSKSSFDVSLAVNSDDFKDLLGANRLDFSLAGYSDISDPENPKFSMSIQATKDFSLEIRRPDDRLYLKANQVPLLALVALGLEPDKLQPLLTNWLVIDTSSLATSARANLDELVSRSDEHLSDSEADARAEALFTKILEEDIAPALTMTSESLDGNPVYKITFAPDQKLLTQIVTKILLEYQEESTGDDRAKTLDSISAIKSFQTILYVDRKESYLRRFDLTMSLESTPDSDQSSPPPLPFALNGPAKASFSIVAKLSDFGKDIPIPVPDSALTPEEFYQKFIEVTGFPGLLPMLASPSAELENLPQF